MSNLHPKTTELVTALRDRLDTRAEEVAEAFEAALTALERAEREALALKRLHQVAVLYDPEVAEVLASLHQVRSSADGVLDHAAKLRRDFDGLISAMRTLDRRQDEVERDLERVEVNLERVAEGDS